MYGEWLILYNTVFNYVLLAFTCEVSGVAILKRRLLLSAFLSGVVAVLFRELSGVSILSFLVLLFTAFGFQLSTIVRRGVIVWIAALFLGGGLLLLQPYLYQLTSSSFLVVSSLVAIVILYLFYRSWQYERQKRLEGSYVMQTALMIEQQEIFLTCYVDTGNVCTEPLSGKPVHFISYDAIFNRLPDDWREGLEKWRADVPYDVSMLPSSLLKKVRFIQLATVQRETTVVLAIRFNKWILMNQNRTLLGEYFVLTKNAANFPKSTEAILHVSALVHYA